LHLIGAAFLCRGYGSSTAHRVFVGVGIDACDTIILYYLRINSIK
jgi:hypothetical protein